MGALPSEVSELMQADSAAWMNALRTGHPVAPEQLAGSAYLGISMGLPGWVDRLAWKTFVKVFAASPGATGCTVGWNVRMQQAGLAGPHRPMCDGQGDPRVFGFFRAAPMPERSGVALGVGHTMLDYGVPQNPWLSPTRMVRDPLVSLVDGSVDVLLGRTYLSVVRGWFSTPSWFALVRRPDLEMLVSG